MYQVTKDDFDYFMSYYGRDGLYDRPDLHDTTYTEFCQAWTELAQHKPDHGV